MQLFLSLIATQKPNTINESIKALDNIIDGYHIDIMDGIFVPHKSWNLNICHNIRMLTQKPFWIHLMTNNPYDLIKNQIFLPQSIITIHKEATHEYKNIASLIKSKHCIPSLALCPETSLTRQDMQYFEHLTIMSVNPGSSGQTFIQDTWNKITMIQQEILTIKHPINLACDGGVNESNIADLATHGIHQVALGNAIFQYQQTKEQYKALESIRNAIKNL